MQVTRSSTPAADFRPRTRLYGSSGMACRIHVSMFCRRPLRSAGTQSREIRGARLVANPGSIDGRCA